MTNLTFPTRPHNGQTYVVGTRTYKYNEATNSWAIYNNNSQVVSNLTATTVVITGTNASTSSITGALTVPGGGIGVGGDIYVGGGIFVSNTSTVNGAQIITTSTLDSFAKKILIYVGTDTAISTTVTSTGTSYTIWNTSTLQTVTDRGNSTTNTISFLNTTNSTNTNIGSIVISGGVGVAQNVYIGGKISIANTGTMVGAEIVTTATFRKLFSAGTDISITNSTTGMSLVFSDISTLQSVTDRGTTTTNIVYVNNTTNSTSTTTGAVVISGGLGLGGRVTAESLRISDTIFDSTQISINTVDTTEVDSYPADQYRTAKYLIQIDEGMGPRAEFESVEIILLVNNDQEVFATEYGAVRTNNPMGAFAADVQNDNVVRLYFTAYNATNKMLKVLRTAMTV
jgi:hypothetical protein